MKRRGMVGAVMLLVAALFTLSAMATTAELYFASDKNGQNRVTNVQEGSTVWVVVYDPDENIDCDVRDKFWTDVKLMDPKTGAYIVWVSYKSSLGDAASRLYDSALYQPYKGHFPGPSAGWLGADYFEETGADTGLFVSARSFQIGTREDYTAPYKNTHVVDDGLYPGAAWPNAFQWGGFEYLSGVRGWFDGTLVHHAGAMGQAFRYFPAWPFEAVSGDGTQTEYLVGRFENMDTLIGMVVDPDDDTDVATTMMKIIDTQATVAWDQQIYKDANGAATLTITDPDENLNCNAVEYVPVFILVNPGSWNPVDGEPWDGIGGTSPTNFCMLKRTGGVTGVAGVGGVAPVGSSPIRWYDIYNSYLNAYGERGALDGRYYIQYATQHQSPWNVVWFDTVNADGITAVSFYAQETGPNTGVFQLNLNSILDDLGFRSLAVRDTLIAYYLDPNDEDDFQVSAAYIEAKENSITSFTDATRQDKEIYWLGRDPVYVQVIDANANVDSCCPEQVVVLVCDPHEEDDAEWIILDETSSNSPVFFTNAGYELLPVWDALGIGNANRRARGTISTGGYQLILDNWRIEAFNEDHIYAQYNDAYYGAPNEVAVENSNDVSSGLAGLGDSDTNTSFPPLITQGPINGIPAGNAENAARAIGSSPGVRVPNDISFDLMEIADTQVYNGQTVNMWFLDRQGNRVNGYMNSDCVFIEVVDPDQNEDVLRRERIDGYWDGGQDIPFGPLANRTFGCAMGDRVFHSINDLLGDTDIFNVGSSPMVYVLNPRSGFWAALDLLETGVTTGDFVSVICVDLVNVTTCVPTLGTLPGDTIVAFYQDPSNHSDSAMIQVKVGIGGGGTPPSQASTTTFVNATGVAVANYTDADLVYVKVVDPSHAGATSLENAVTINGQAFSLAPAAGMPADAFMTAGIDLALAAGATITATYVDPSDPTDTSSDTITIIASKLEVTSFYAGPSPAAGPVTFGYKGTGIASVMSVAVVDLAGHLVWTNELANVSSIVWDPAAGPSPAANGCYIYLVKATDGTDTFSGKGTLFINR